MSIEIRQARAADFDELCGVINAAFEYGAGGRPSMEQVYPRLFRRSDESMDRYNVACEDGRILSNVAVYPMTMVIRGARLRAGAIGMVGTLPEHRGRGLMSRLLRRSIERMDAEGMDISILGGDRQRYGKLGWENSGRRVALHMNARSVPEDAERGFEVRRGRVEDAQALLAMHEAEPVRVERTLESFGLSIGREDYPTWVAMVKGRPAGYIVRFHNTIMETGGRPDAIAAAIAHVLGETEDRALEVDVPVGADERSRTLIAMSSRWNIRQGWMIRIMDLASTLGTLAPVLGENRRRAGVTSSGEVSLEDVETGASVRIACEGEEVTVTPGRADVHLALSKHELVQVIFGTAPPGELFFEGDIAKSLDALFPVDYFLGGHDTF